MKPFFLIVTILSLLIIPDGAVYSLLPGDLDGDGDVDGGDMSIFSQYFGTIEPCGSNVDCPLISHYCAKQPGNCSSPGSCQARPEVCIDTWQPVCGCDGNTYGNSCLASVAGVNVAESQPCPSKCDDGTTWMCDSLPSQCSNYEIPALQNGCYRCVNPATCFPWGEPGCRTDSDCPLDRICDPCGTSSCPFCDDCVPACRPKGPRISNYSNSECLPNKSTDLREDQYPWCSDEEVIISAIDRSLTVTHKNVTYNCCLDEVQVSLRVDGNILHLDEKEVLTHPCKCLCCYNVDTRLYHLTPGDYLLNYCWHDYETERTECYAENLAVR